jgi:hypothetical protein
MEIEVVRSPSSAESLQRIQTETQRVRNRLLYDSEKSQVSSPTKSIKLEAPLQEIVIEPSLSSFFEDPAPVSARSMSVAMSQHEAFKARYVNDIGGAAFVSLVEGNLLTL